MWDARAVIVLVLAVAVSLTHVISLSLAAWHGKSLTETGGDVLIAVLGAIIAIIAGYVASKPPKDADIPENNTLPQEKPTTEKEDETGT